MTNNIYKERENLCLNGLMTTDIMQLMLHGRQMKIFFAYSNQGDVCELIGVR